MSFQHGGFVPTKDSRTPPARKEHGTRHRETPQDGTWDQAARQEETSYRVQWRIYIVKFWTRAPPWGSKFFQFHAVFGKIWQNRMLVPPGELAPPPQGNPGSTTGVVTALVELRELVFVFGKAPIHFQLDTVFCNRLVFDPTNIKNL